MAKQSFVPDNGIEEDFDFANVQKCLNCDKDECNNCLAYVKKGCKKQPFTEEELMYVCDSSLSVRTVAKIINHSRNKIQSYRSYKGIKANNSSKDVYSQEDNDFILTHSIEECVERFNKSAKTLREKQRRLLNGIQRQSTQNTH